MNHVAIRPGALLFPRRLPEWLVRAVLAVVLGFGALNAFGGGIYGLAGAEKVPTAWLAGTPFADYFVPSFVLFVVVGGSMATAAVAVARRARFARTAALAAGAIVLAWITVQVAMIGFVSWLQPVTAAGALLVLALAPALPRDTSTVRVLPLFARTYVAALRRPRETFEVLVASPRHVQLGTLALLSNAALYTIVYVLLVMGGGRPSAFPPWLAIDPEVYYRWNTFLLAPSMVASWVLASAAVHFLARALGGKGTFEATLAVLGFGTALASWWTLLHDLVTAGLGAFHVIDQRAYEDGLSGDTPFRALLWALMAGYLVAFVVLFGEGATAAHGIPRRRALVVGLVGFVVYQGVFFVFNR